MLDDLLLQAAECQDLVADREGCTERYALVAKYDSEEQEWKGSLFVI
ncbi:MAG: hypothetical protein JSW38_01735 [Dehalococcoidia bacterium]|nr:MAG: hypothetical protein JSW38_01735 [Dehalococcoidia bacterium]